MGYRWQPACPDIAIIDTVFTGLQFFSGLKSFLVEDNLPVPEFAL
jgi:hypothetical protein